MMEARGGALTPGVRRLRPPAPRGHLDGNAIAIDRSELTMGTSTVRVGGRVEHALDLSGLHLARADLAPTTCGHLPAAPALGAHRGRRAVTGSAESPASAESCAGAGPGHGDSRWTICVCDSTTTGGRCAWRPSISPRWAAGSTGAARSISRAAATGSISGAGGSRARASWTSCSRAPSSRTRARGWSAAPGRIYERLEGTIDLEGAGFLPEEARGIATLSFRAPGQAPGTPGAFLLDALVRVEQGEMRFERLRLDSADLRVRVGNPATPPTPARRELPRRSAGIPQSG
jgi:hypothetical protein